MKNKILKLLVSIGLISLALVSCGKNSKNGKYNNRIDYSSDYQTVDNEDGYTITEVADKNATSIFIEETINNKKLTQISANVFEECKNLTSVYYKGTLNGWLKVSLGNEYSSPMANASKFYIQEDSGSIEYRGENYREVTSITLDKSIKSINPNQFYGFTNISAVYYNGTVDDWMRLSLGNEYSSPMVYANDFYYQNSEGTIEHNDNTYSLLESLVLSDAYTSIPDYQFYGFKCITSLTIPQSVIEVGQSAFRACTKLDNVYYNSTIADWCNISFENESSNPMYSGKKFYIDREEVNSIIIPSSVTTINSYQFYGFNNVTEIVVPKTVTTIKTAAFAACTSLDTLIVPFVGRNAEDTTKYPLGYIFGEASYADSYLVTQIYDDNGEKKSTDYYIPNNLKNIIIDGATSISDGAFYNCGKIKSITFSDDIESIGEDAFYNCIELEEVHYKSTLLNWCSIDFENESSNPMYYAKKYYIVDDSSEQMLTALNIPTTLEEIKPYTFSFTDESTLVEANIPASVLKIDSNAFYGAGIKRIIIPSTVEEIAEGAFSGCSKVEFITLAFIGNKAHEATDMYQYSFGYIFGRNYYSGATATLQHYYGAGDIEYKTYYIPDSLKSVAITDTTIIPYGAFDNCGFISKIEIPETVTRIDNFAFNNCSHLEEVYYASSIDGWYNIAFGNSLSNPMYYATNIYELNNEGGVIYNSHNYSVVKNIVLSSSMVEENALKFYGFDGLENVYYLGSAEEYINNIAAWFNPLYYATNFYYLDENGTVTYKDNKFSRLDSLTILSTTETIKSYQLSQKSLQTVVIPASVTLIEENAFYKSENLTSVYYDGTITDWCHITFKNEYSNPMYYATRFYIKDDNGTVEYKGNTYSLLTTIVLPDTVYIVGDYQFYGFDQVTSVTLNNVAAIGYEAFKANSNLEEIIINNIVVLIEEKAFANNPSLKTVSIYDVREIKKNAFYGSEEIDRVFYGDDDTSWLSISFENEYSNPLYYASTFYKISADGNVVFNDKKYSLSDTIVVDNTINYIDDYAFATAAIKNITLGSGIYKINSNILKHTTALESITIPASVTEIDEYAFLNCSRLDRVYYNGTLEEWCRISFENEYSNPMSRAEFFYLGTNLVEQIDLTSVSYVNSYALSFKKSSAVSKITIPRGTQLEQYAFYGASALVYLKLEVSGVRDSTFANCTNLKTVVILDKWFDAGSYAFYNCTGITDVFFKGEEEFERVYLTLGQDNTALLSSTWHYYIKWVDESITLTLENDGKWTIVDDEVYLIEYVLVTYQLDVDTLETEYVLKNSILKEVPTPLEKEGYTFAFWSTSPKGLTTFDVLNEQISENITLYAIYELNE